MLQGGLDRYSRFIFDLTTALLMYLTFRSNIFLYACSINATVTPEFKTKGILFVGMRDTVHTVLVLITLSN